MTRIPAYQLLTRDDQARACGALAGAVGNAVSHGITAAGAVADSTAAASSTAVSAVSDTATAGVGGGGDAGTGSWLSRGTRSQDHRPRYDRPKRRRSGWERDHRQEAKLCVHREGCRSSS